MAQHPHAAPWYTDQSMQQTVTYGNAAFVLCPECGEGEYWDRAELGEGSHGACRHRLDGKPCPICGHSVGLQTCEDGPEIDPTTGEEITA